MMQKGYISLKDFEKQFKMTPSQNSQDAQVSENLSGRTQLLKSADHSVVYKNFNKEQALQAWWSKQVNMLSSSAVGRTTGDQLLNEENNDDQIQLNQGEIPMDEQAGIDTGVTLGLGTIIKIDGEPLILRVLTAFALGPK